MAKSTYVCQHIQCSRRISGLETHYVVDNKMVIHYVSEFQKVTYSVEHMIYVSGCLVYRNNADISINLSARY